jgi:hypothetical protein
MSIIGEVVKELFGMFVADARLTAAILFLVAGAAGLVAIWQTEPLIAGGVLLFGSLAILVEAVYREAAGRTRRRDP